MTPLEEQEFMTRTMMESDRSMVMFGSVLLLTMVVVAGVLVYFAFLR